jgi:hypothetical protein
MFYVIIAILFLKPSLKKEDMTSQILRGICGLAFGFLVFYLFNADRSFSFILAALWFPALVQLGLAVTGIIKEGYSSDKIIVPLVMFALFSLSFGYNNYPYITGNSKVLAEMVPVRESTDKLSKIDSEHVVVISPETAYYEMQKMIGTLPNPSVYRIGELGTTMVKGEAVYVAPIEIDGFLKALSYGEIPGVIYVSAEKQSEAKIINIPVKSAESLAFNKNLYRQLRQHKKDSILFQANAELDDEGNPYYVGSYGYYEHGRKGPVIDGVLILSFKNGEITDYSKDKAPAWVDQVYPSDVAEVYNDYFGTLKKGFLNKLIAKNGVHIPTAWYSETNVNGLYVNSTEVTGVIDADGKFKWFTDHTNTSETSTTMTGYSLTDMRTGEMKYYITPGYINGRGAMNAVDKSLGANKANWAPVQPLFYNLFGSEAWVVPVVNKTDGAMVKVAIVSAQSSYVVIEDSKDAAIEGYKNAIAYGKISENSNKNANSIKAEEKVISGVISRINSVTENGNTIFYVKLLGNEKLFMINKSAGVDIVITKENDTVDIKYMDIKDNGIVSTTWFKNRSIK